MDELHQEWEGVAEDVLRSTDCDEPPVDAFVLAACCGFDVIPTGGSRASLVGDTIRVSQRVRRERQHGLVAHEIGHWALQRGGLEDTEEGARYMAGALLLPRKPFEKDIGCTWNVAELRARHLNASAEMVARRIVGLREAVATVIDNGRVRARIASPWIRDPRLKRTTRWERELADHALEIGESVQGDSLVWATPVIDGRWRRVVIVAEARQLSLRL